MNAATTSFTVRCALWMGALFTATCGFAGAADDVRLADEALARGDLPTGMALLRKAADQNHSRAQARLGDLLRSAEYEAEAVAMYRKSAAQGDAAGEYGLGRAYADGAGVKKDPSAALEWYRKAEKQNYPQAFDALARAYRTGSLGLGKDLEQARQYQQRYDELVKALEKKAAP